MPHAYGGATMPMPSAGMADPHLQPGGDFHVIDLGNGNAIALCPECYANARMSILNDTQAAMDNSATNNVNWNSIAWNPVNWNSGKS